MKIDRKNYEIYFIDYLDGTLTEKEKTELQAFLLANPGLAEELEGISGIRLEAPSLVYRKKTLLKKAVTDEYPDYYAIAEAENVLSPEEARQIGNRRQEPEFRERVRTYRRIKVRPDFALTYPRKKELYRKPARTVLFFRISAAAAAVILLFIPFRSIFFQPAGTREKVPETSVMVMKTEPITLQRSFYALQGTRTPQPPGRLTPRTPRPSAGRLAGAAERPEVLLTATVVQEPVLSLPQTLVVPERDVPEIRLHPSAQTWRTSSSFAESKDIVTSFIQAGKYLAGKMKRNDVR